MSCSLISLMFSSSITRWNFTYKRLSCSSRIVQQRITPVRENKNKRPVREKKGGTTDSNTYNLIKSGIEKISYLIILGNFDNPIECLTLNT